MGSEERSLEGSEGAPRASTGVRILSSIWNCDEPEVMIMLNLWLEPANVHTGVCPLNVQLFPPRIHIPRCCARIFWPEFSWTRTFWPVIHLLWTFFSSSVILKQKAISVKVKVVWCEKSSNLGRWQKPVRSRFVLASVPALIPFNLTPFNLIPFNF